MAEEVESQVFNVLVSNGKEIESTEPAWGARIGNDAFFTWVPFYEGDTVEQGVRRLQDEGGLKSGPFRVIEEIPNDGSVFWVDARYPDYTIEISGC